MPGPMEVIEVSETDDRCTASESRPPFQLTRLRPEERELWDEHFAGSTDAPTVTVWGFGYACMLELWGPPPVVVEYLREHDPDNRVRQYLDNMRRARWEGRL